MPGAVKGFSHRGSDMSRENTAAAFQAVAQLGFRYFETDLRTTLDGKLVCFHDSVLDRVTDRRGPISKYTWDELKDVRVGGEPILLFEELLATFPDHHVNVDLKDSASSQYLGRLIRRYDAAERVLVGSFQDNHRINFFRSFPRYRNVMASSGGQRCLTMLWSVSRLGVNAATLAVGKRMRKQLLIDAAQVPVYEKVVRVTDRRFIEFCHALGIEVHVWTINDPATMEQLIDLGVDGLVSDDGPALAGVLDRHGFWPQ
ncbi:glycerophosphodiester phosphodiesterase family protein [Micrococcoides hystricis]|uniref:Glycerophosphodiester phosphodiesterase family protein n=1 Tax=Micrococcoides hystricis TaxID=1572761 RepID=A0ABV6PBZ2_9MICC